MSKKELDFAPPAAAAPLKARPCAQAASAVGDSTARRAPPCALTVFGASGDLAARKLLPALLRLGVAGELPDAFAVVGFGRKAMTDDAFRAHVKSVCAEALGDACSTSLWARLAPAITYCSGDYADPAAYVRLRERLERADRERGTRGNRLYYLATPESVFAEVARQLAVAGLISPPASSGPFSRIVVEKPFGRGLDSARGLNAALSACFDESQILRIDHYLGKETVQNLLVFRFANSIFEPLWNRQQIDHVQITAAETVGVESRAAYYEPAGALRDMVQSHLLEVLALVAMEPPGSLEADSIRDEKAKVFRALQPIDSSEAGACAVRGQYGPGSLDGRAAAGYRSEPGVDPDSRTPTFAALRVYIDNWRWQGVPFYIRTGKRLAQRVTQVNIHFRPVPLCLFRTEGREHAVCLSLRPNVLSFRLQPNEGIDLCFTAKVPGRPLQVAPVRLNFHYQDVFGKAIPEAYERLLLDAMAGDATLFSRIDAVEATWSFLGPILDAWENGPAPEYPNYAAGSWGPDAADDLLRVDGRAWQAM